MLLIALFVSAQHRETDVGHPKMNTASLLYLLYLFVTQYLDVGHEVCVWSGFGGRHSNRTQ